MHDQAFTMIPNAVLAAMPAMKDAELRVVLAVARMTIGWQLDERELSISQIEVLTGLSRQGVVNGIAAALARGVLARRSTGSELPETSRRPGFLYRIVNYVDYSSNKLVHEVDQLVNDVDCLPRGLVNIVDYLPVNDVDYSDADLPHQDAPNEMPKEIYKERERSESTERAETRRSANGERAARPPTRMPSRNTPSGDPHQRCRAVRVLVEHLGGRRRPNAFQAKLLSELVPENDADAQERWAAAIAVQLAAGKHRIDWMIERYKTHDDRLAAAKLRQPSDAPPVAQEAASYAPSYAQSRSRTYAQGTQNRPSITPPDPALGPLAFGALPAFGQGLSPKEREELEREVADILANPTRYAS